MTPPRVLVADDDDAIRVLVARVLTRVGITVDAVPDGQEAIERLDASAYDAVVLDLMMPRVDGLGVIEHMVDTRPEMLEKTIVITAFATDAARERVHHMCVVVSKPFDVMELVRAVRNRIALTDGS